MKIENSTVPVSWKRLRALGKILHPIDVSGWKIWSLELFNTPTLAFKDYALFPLARLIDRALQKRKDQSTILCATPGDTGASTAAAFAGMENCRAVVLFPKGRVSEVQRMQITRTGADNIIPIEIDGDFDDCQRLVKEAFKQKRRTENKLVSVNSINIVRLVLQSTYYFQTALRLKARAKLSTSLCDSHGICFQPISRN